MNQKAEDKGKWTKIQVTKE